VNGFCSRLAAGLLGAASLLGCTFPDIEIGSGGAGSSSSKSSVASASPTVGSTSSGSTTSTSTATTSASSSSSSSTGTGGTGCPCLLTTNCDCDGDTVPRYDPAHGCMGVGNDPAKSDCNDCVMDVHPGQTGYFTTAVPGTTTDYDYDCNGQGDPKFAQGSCTAHATLGGCALDFAQSTPVCGMPVTIDHCGDGSALGKCITSGSDVGVPMPCR
jgi:hypothetical protein